MARARSGLRNIQAPPDYVIYGYCLNKHTDWLAMKCLRISTVYKAKVRFQLTSAKFAVHVHFNYLALYFMSCILCHISWQLQRQLLLTWSEGPPPGGGEGNVCTGACKWTFWKQRDAPTRVFFFKASSCFGLFQTGQPNFSTVFFWGGGD